MSPGNVVRGLLVLSLVAIAILSSAAGANDFPAVKKSRNGICHERGTVHYVQTRTFETYDSMEECIASGGRMAYAAPVDAATVTEPSRAVSATFTFDIVLVLLIVSAVAGLALVFYWWPRYRKRRQLRQLEHQARERWEGHRLEPKKPPKS